MSFMRLFTLALYQSKLIVQEYLAGSFLFCNIYSCNIDAENKTLLVEQTVSEQEEERSETVKQQPMTSQSTVIDAPVAKVETQGASYIHFLTICYIT